MIAETMQQEPIEIISLEEFAKRMGVARTTVFEWVKRGKLLPGRHFIKIGRVIRFEWGPDLLKKLYEDSDAPTVASHNVKPPQTRSSRTGSKQKAAIDLDY
jgi:predicted DNA-binding transcriptional regulator AlpA